MDVNFAIFFPSKICAFSSMGTSQVRVPETKGLFVSDILAQKTGRAMTDFISS